jgi:DNA-binding beta-propeller fold protein YncE
MIVPTMYRRSAIALAMLFCGAIALAQSVPPAGSPPNPYTTIDRWGTLPAGRQWGGVSAIDVDRDGRSVWVAERCGGGSYADSSLAPILKLDRTGAVVSSFGAGLFVVPHGIDVDADGNVWVTDASDGVNAIVKFSRDGRFLATWGRKGAAPGEIDLPHSLAMDSRGGLFVADLNNFRVELFSQDGQYLHEWRQFGMPGGLFIDRNDVLYVADSLSGSDRHPGWVRGIRTGRPADGMVTAFIADRTPNANPITAAEGVAADIDGNVFGAVVPAQMLQKHVRR